MSVCRSSPLKQWRMLQYTLQMVYLWLQSCHLYRDMKTVMCKGYNIHTYIPPPWNSPSWEVNRFSASREIRRILWSSKFFFFFNHDYESLTHAPPPAQSHFLKTHLNIALPSKPLSSKWPVSPQVSPRKPCMDPSSPPHTCYIPSPPQSSRFDHLNDIWWGVQILKLTVCAY